MVNMACGEHGEHGMVSVKNNMWHKSVFNYMLIILILIILILIMLILMILITIIIILY